MDKLPLFVLPMVLMPGEETELRIFEPRSTLERIIDNWVFMPIYFKMAAQTTVIKK